MYLALSTLADYMNETASFKPEKRLRDALVESDAVFAGNRVEIIKKAYSVRRNERCH